MFERRALAASLLFLAMTPTAARAYGLIVPFLGVKFGGDSGRELSNAIDAQRFNWGASFAYMGGGVVGLEADIGYSPDFFGKTDIGGSSVLTVTGNLLFGIPFGGQKGFGIRPYALVGAGVIRSEVNLFNLVSFEKNQAAWDFGGGVMLFFGTNIGIRGDLRYFRSFGDVGFDILDLINGPGNIDFARASGGVVLRF